MKKKTSSLEIGDITTVPPALMIMLQEFSSGGDWSDTRKRIRAALRDMKDQSKVFDVQNSARSAPTNASRFEIHTHGALDLLSGNGCRELKCRVAAAERLARSLGLIADTVWMTDYLSTAVFSMGRATNDAIDRLMCDALAMEPLLPLMKAGIVRFTSPWRTTCNGCHAKFEAEIQSAIQPVLDAFVSHVKVKRNKSGGYFVTTGDFFSPPIVLHGDCHDNIRSRRDIAEYLIAREVRGILWAAHEATHTKGALFSNSRVALAGLLQCEGRLPTNCAELRVLEDSRAFDLPWISELKPYQVLQLREEACNAIPLFRELLARATTSSDNKSASNVSKDIIAELRAQAADVRAELSAKQSKSARYWKVTYGVLGLGISAFGVATDQVVTAVGGLLPVIQLLVAHKTGHELDVAKLCNRPGYVLVKAQDILAHAH